MSDHQYDPAFPMAVPLAIAHLPEAQAYRFGSCGVLISRDDGIWHMSISHPTRYPKWEEIKAARYRFLPPDIYVCQVLPPPGRYVNIHQNCFHLWELNARTLDVVIQ